MMNRRYCNRESRAEQRVEMKKKREDFFYLLNILAELLDESFWNCKSKSTRIVTSDLLIKKMLSVFG